MDQGAGSSERRGAGPRRPSAEHPGAESKPAVPALIAALKDKDPLVRQRAAEALGNITPEAAPVVQAFERGAER